MQEEGKEFEELFIEAVDEALKTLGENGRQTVFFLLEKSYSLKRQEIPRKPETFAAELEKIFGAGALVLQKLVLESLYPKLGLKYEDKRDYTFADYLNKVKHAKEDIKCQSSSHRKINWRN
jgi:hypothetical protein